MARALAHKPEVLLLDEPFGALDAKIREELRRTIREVQRELGITTVLVTHDQEEAFAMADRIGIMNLGRLLEVGAPHDLYSRPATRFVATFLGAANLILARRTADGIQVCGATIAAADAHPRPPASTKWWRWCGRRKSSSRRRARRSPQLPRRRGTSKKWCSPARWSACACGWTTRRMTPLLAHDGSDDDASALLEVTRTQHEQRGFAVSPGQNVAVGVRRVHVLPTPLSSFTACAASAQLAEALSREPLLVELAARMKTRISDPRRAAAGRGGRALRRPPHLRRHDRHRRTTRRRAYAPSGCCGAARRPAGAAARAPARRSAC